MSHFQLTVRNTIFLMKCFKMETRKIFLVLHTYQIVFINNWIIDLDPTVVRVFTEKSESMEIK